MYLGHERRSFPRSVVRTPAEIMPVGSGQKATSYPCTVINISEGGALIEVNKFAVPDEFDLVYRGQNLFARVVGRSEGKVRVHFAGAPA